MTPEEKRKPSEVLFDEIIGSRNGVRRRNIEALRVVCDHMDTKGIDLVAAEVVRRCDEDGPAYSTVMNKGSPLGEYIRLRRIEQAAIPRKGASVAAISALLLDPVLKARTEELESRVTWLHRENCTLRLLLKTLRPGFPIDRAIDAGPGPDGGLNLALAADAAGTSIASDAAASAVLALLTHLVRDRGSYEMYRGRLCINKKPILGIDELASIRSVSGLSKEEWVERFGEGAVVATPTSASETQDK